MAVTLRPVEQRAAYAQVAALDRAVAELASCVRLLHAVTPTNASAERRRLRETWEHGGEATPRWTYGAPPSAPSPASIAELARAASAHRSPWGDVYLARIEELALELAVQSASGRPELSELAARRFATIAPTDADATAARWVAARERDVDPAPERLTDDPHPASLKSLLEAEIGARRLPFGVKVTAGLASLAATGAQNVYVAAGRSVSDVVARRTAIHEIEGHVVPRARSRTAPLRIFSVGTARGHDTQEGYALWHEEQAGVLSTARRAELGMRHLACGAMDRGADFVEVMRELVRTHGAPVATAIAIAERIFRGSDGRSPGLGRERVYLPELLRVRARLHAHPEDALVLGAGQLGLDVLELARPIALEMHTRAVA